MNKIALLIDYENFHGHVDGIRRLVLDIEKMGDVLVKRAYADWVRFNSARKTLSSLQIELIELPNVVNGKNSADIRLVIDAIDFSHTKQFLTTFVLLSSDSDFLPLITRLREYNKRTILVGCPTKTCEPMRTRCDLFIPITSYLSASVLEVSSACLDTQANVSKTDARPAVIAAKAQVKKIAQSQTAVSPITQKPKAKNQAAKSQAKPKPNCNQPVVNDGPISASPKSRPTDSKAIDKNRSLTISQKIEKILREVKKNHSQLLGKATKKGKNERSNRDLLVVPEVLDLFRGPLWELWGKTYGDTRFSQEDLRGFLQSAVGVHWTQQMNQRFQAYLEEFVRQGFLRSQWTDDERIYLWGNDPYPFEADTDAISDESDSNFLESLAVDFADDHESTDACDCFADACLDTLNLWESPPASIAKEWITPSGFEIDIDWLSEMELADLHRRHFDIRSEILSKLQSSKRILLKTLKKRLLGADFMASKDRASIYEELTYHVQCLADLGELQLIHDPYRKRSYVSRIDYKPDDIDLEIASCLSRISDNELLSEDSTEGLLFGFDDAWVGNPSEWIENEIYEDTIDCCHLMNPLYF